MSGSPERVQRWNEAAQGPLSERALKTHLERQGYKVRHCSYPAKVWIPEHSHSQPTVDAVLSGSIIVLGSELRRGQWLELEPGEPHEVLAESAAFTLHGVKEGDHARGARVAILVALVAAINIWCSLHLGVRVESLLTINALIGAVPAVLHFARRSVEKSFHQFAAEWLDLLLSKAGLCLLAGAFFLVGSFTTSVTIESTLDDPVGMRLISSQSSTAGSGDKRWLTPGASERFFCWTHFGPRVQTLQVDGFRGKTVRLYPWWPRRFTTHDEYLEPNIAVLVRLDLGLPRNTGKTVVKTGNKEIEVQTGGDSASFVLGDGDLYIPDSAVEKWDSNHRKNWPLWLNFRKLKDPLVLVPHSEVELRFLNLRGECKAWRKFRIGRERFQDRLLGRGPCPS